MTWACKIVLPSERFRVEEISVPEELASALAGQAVDAEVFPELPVGHAASTWTTYPTACRSWSAATASHGMATGPRPVARTNSFLAFKYSIKSMPPSTTLFFPSPFPMADLV